MTVRTPYGPQGNNAGQKVTIAATASNASTPLTGPIIAVVATALCKIRIGGVTDSATAVGFPIPPNELVFLGIVDNEVIHVHGDGNTGTLHIHPANVRSAPIVKP